MSIIFQIIDIIIIIVLAYCIAKIVTKLINKFSNILSLPSETIPVYVAGGTGIVYLIALSNILRSIAYLDNQIGGIRLAGDFIAGLLNNTLWLILIISFMKLHVSHNKNIERDGENV